MLNVFASRLLSVVARKVFPQKILPPQPQPFALIFSSLFVDFGQPYVSRFKLSVLGLWSTVKCFEPPVFNFGQPFNSVSYPFLDFGKPFNVSCYPFLFLVNRFRA